MTRFLNIFDLHIWQLIIEYSNMSPSVGLKRFNVRISNTGLRRCGVLRLWSSFHTDPSENSLLQNQPRDPLLSKYIPFQFNSSSELTFFKFIQILDIGSCCVLLPSSPVTGSICKVLFVVWRRVLESSSYICCEGGDVPCQLADNEKIVF